MNSPSSRYLAMLGLACLVALPAHAQWAVVDAPAIVQLVQQVRTMQQQLQTTRDQLVQSQQALRAMTGGRGMEVLLSGTPRNYLPSNWAQISNAIQGGGRYPELASDVRSTMSANAILSSQQLALLSSASQQSIIADRQASALQQALAQEALSNVSGRFAAIQTLISAIASAGDQKAVLDLQARISAELGMLQNEQTKLQVLHEATAAQQSVNTQQTREEIVAAHGRFESRFQPSP